MRRRLHRRERKRRNKIIIGSIFCFMFLISTGYAAFSTSLSLNAKGNIAKKKSVDITENVVTEGAGLYVDTYETEGTRYIYKGAKPLLLK